MVANAQLRDNAVLQNCWRAQWVPFEEAADFNGINNIKSMIAKTCLLRVNFNVCDKLGDMPVA